ncbi:MAG: cysteine--tRNA ligase [Thermoproteales archaeon]|nr:cysteine--tRNA ligase [Thermoproteales archaeon]RLE65673.1 MAG: cysteine--tRNA ligase [Thermoprotei archaeon]
MLKVSDTLKNTKREFKPYDNKNVKIYVCGPTVYDNTHVGHARTYLAFDVIVRYLRYKGYKVKYVVNITDIDDKIINKANRLGVSYREIASKYERDFFECLRRLNIAPADYYPRATEHIEDMIKIITRLIEKGYAYVVDGDVYFNVPKYTDYGKLSKQKIEKLIAGARVEVNSNKRNPLDFALWKKAKPKEPSWPSPWGPGRPGWHIECTAMSVKYLGEQIDIHGGGADLIFPHHENELAQTEAFTGKKPFVKYWLHTGLLQIQGEKMSKSLGNIVTVKEFLSKYQPDVLRYLVLSSHYRSPINLSEKKVKECREAVERLHMFMEKTRLLTYNVREEVDPSILDETSRQLYLEALKTVQKFENSMDNDFHTPGALAAIFELVGKVEPLLYKPKIAIDPKVLKVIYDIMDKLLRKTLGFILPKVFPNYITVVIEALLKAREEFRHQKKWKMADYIRDSLRKIGIIVEDTAEGPVWKISSEKLREAYSASASSSYFSIS